MSSRLEKIFQEGCDARASGVDSDKNPYSTKTEAEAWFDGWLITDNQMESQWGHYYDDDDEIPF